MSVREDVDLRVFEFGPDYVVARSRDDAWTVYIEHVGGDRGDYDGEDMEPVSPDFVIGIYVDADGHLTDESDGEALRLTAAEWAKREGRGFLCSSEF